MALNCLSMFLRSVCDTAYSLIPDAFQMIPANTNCGHLVACLNS